MAERIPLPVTDCNGCGACCLHVGSPPMYAFFASLEAQGEEGSLPTDLDDFQRWRQLPESLRREVIASNPGKGPCIWYDAASRRCRHYEDRPEVCRDLEVGGEDCLRHRANAGIK